MVIKTSSDLERQVSAVLSPLSLSPSTSVYANRTANQSQTQAQTAPVGRAETTAPTADPNSIGRMLPVTGNTDAEGNVRTSKEQPRVEECQTCKERTYQDGSDDPGVSFKTPANIDPDTAASVVRGHEQEHVSHEQAAARREGRKVVSQSVTLHSSICPECGRTYISGGTTRTVTKNAAANEAIQPAAGKSEDPQQGGFSAWA